MSRYAKKFSELKAKNEGAFIPFVLVGDPNYEDSLAVIETLVENGADALELGILFSDPMADGPIIQNAGVRAFEAGITVEKSFEIIAKIREKYPEIPIGLLMYANLVYRHTLDVFYQKAKDAGVDSVLVVDVPLREYESFKASATAHDIESVFIIPPNASEETIRQTALEAEGYIYLMSRSGTTGLNQATDESLPKLVEMIHSLTDVPIVQGFGISTKEQVKAAIDMGADGAISGSFLVSLIEKHHHNMDELKAILAEQVTSLKSGTR